MNGMVFTTIFAYFSNNTLSSEYFSLKFGRIMVDLCSFSSSTTTSPPPLLPSLSPSRPPTSPEHLLWAPPLSWGMWAWLPLPLFPQKRGCNPRRPSPFQRDVGDSVLLDRGSREAGRWGGPMGWDALVASCETIHDTCRGLCSRSIHDEEEGKNERKEGWNKEEEDTTTTKPAESSTTKLAESTTTTTMKPVESTTTTTVEASTTKPVESMTMTTAESTTTTTTKTAESMRQAETRRMVELTRRGRGWSDTVRWGRHGGDEAPNNQPQEGVEEVCSPNSHEEAKEEGCDLTQHEEEEDACIPAQHEEAKEDTCSPTQRDDKEEGACSPTQPNK